MGADTVIVPVSAVPESDLRGASILIVDDEEPNVRLLARILARAGYTNVRTTTSARDGVQMFADARPDLVCLDIHMPDLDGYAVLARLRVMSSATDFLPVLAITGDASPETRQRVLIAGAKDFLEKPFEAAEVLVRVENLLTTRLLHRSLQRQNESLEEKVRERTAELQSTLMAAEAASRAKGQFLATMSHELRTPLNSVIGFAHQLQKNKAGNLTPQDLMFAQRIAEGGTHLLRIIDDILDLSRIEAGKALVERGAVDVRAVCEAVVAEVGSDPHVQARTISFAVSAPDELRAIHTDERTLRRILMNLVSNAGKFTENGTVRVQVSGSSTGMPERIDVIDTGIGIPPDRLSAIFEMFEQADNSTQRRYGGTGLGLALSRTLSELLGYRLSVVSELGAGSAFSILLETGASAPRSYAELARGFMRAPVLM